MKLSTATEYREFAFRAASDPNHPLHLVPKLPQNVHTILDVGCHAGHILEAMQLPESCQAFGCDVSTDALEIARQRLPNAIFTEARAEKLPYQSSFFDMVFARGVVTVLDIPVALAEFSRVLKPGGKLWLSLHRWRDCRKALQSGGSKNPVKLLAVQTYALLNTVWFAYTGRLVRYPFNRSRIVSFQTEGRMRKELLKAGFVNVNFSYGTYFVVEANKRAMEKVSSSAAA